MGNNHCLGHQCNPENEALIIREIRETMCTDYSSLDLNHDLGIIALQETDNEGTLDYYNTCRVLQEVYYKPIAKVRRVVFYTYFMDTFLNRFSQWQKQNKRYVLLVQK